MTVQRSFTKAFEIAAEFRAKKLATLPETDGDKPFPLFVKKSDAEGELWIYEVIGEDWWTGGGVTAKSVVEALAAMKGVKTLNIFINSPGGDVFEAKAILTNLERFDAEIVVNIDGIAASAATFIAMAGDRIVTAPHGTWMVHEASAFAYGRAEDMRAMADVLDQQNRDLAEKYAKQTGKTVDEMLQVMADETWMSAQEALDQGFTDEISQLEPVEETTTASAIAAKAPALAAALATDERVRSARQARRLEQLSARASPASPRPAASAHPAAPASRTRP